MTIKERYKAVFDWFQEHMPVAETELEYSNPFELIVSVVLSAQCTDKRVNMTTPKLFHDFPTIESMADSSPEVIFDYIKSITYPNNKSKSLVGLAQKLLSDYDGIIPDDVDELQKLPGVGRKTANVVASVLYDKPVMPVDTHVFRISERLGLTTNSKTPLQTEKTLVKYIPKELIPKAHHWLILHARYICQARKPKCEQCGLSPWCRYYEKEVKPKILLNS